ncbi:alpha-2-macroglobulin receptor-associated protein [Toxorhynchites rutilus septentrionalis]|uniref:alpha-2-macroglobulin receptor-associated protein n=1 Tax=Toxorhynchites rutilus septentrionalis TaxID=329112 RepID=UPI002478F6FB|nr:alpha-2-macroglobulin receptor-associated protein [Toxorhynchites rutilus septentrionalis]
MWHSKLLLVASIAVHLFPTDVNADGGYKHKVEKPYDKYSKKANNLPASEIYEPDFRNIQRPFRMAKLNLVWTKAQHRLTEPKLKSLYTELKIHDKEEIAWKQLSSQHKDKEGIKEAELRKKLIGIMSTYGLLEHFDDTQDPEKYKPYKAYSGGVDSYKNKSLFKDKKLNKLWEKAETSGFTKEELDTLKEEFEHHQEKIDVYYNLLEQLGDADVKSDNAHENAINKDEHDKFNEIGTALEDSNDIMAQQKAQKKQKELQHKSNELRETHRNIRDNFDRLERIASKGPNSQDFIEPQVQGLWRIAVSSNFTADELASLKVELLHYESRLLKLRHMHAEHALSMEKHKNAKHGDKADTHKIMEDNIKKQTRKVEKIKEQVEGRILKHGEL